jgi:hypothetical protein
MMLLVKGNNAPYSRVNNLPLIVVRIVVLYNAIDAPPSISKPPPSFVAPE